MGIDENMEKISVSQGVSCLGKSSFLEGRFV